MKLVNCKCPECKKDLIYCPELIYSNYKKDSRPILKCETKGCLNENQYLVLANSDNFGDKITEV